jgi:hypothetical protein
MLKRLINKIDEIRFRDFLSYSFVFAILFAIPLSVVVAQRETYKRAGASNDSFSELSIDENQVPYPNLPPYIKDVQKQYGKIGDSIVIMGENFGDLQKQSTITIGGALLSKEEIPYWSNNQIEAVIPERASDGIVEVEINNRSSKWNGVLTIIR